MEHGFHRTEGRVSLLPMTAADSEEYRIMRNVPGTREWFLSGKEITMEEQFSWYSKYVMDDREFMFSIYFEDKLVGGCGIYNIDNRENSAEYGRIVISQNRRGGGIAQSATRCAVSIAKEDIGLQKLYLEVRSDNIPAIKVYENVGFIRNSVMDDVIKMTFLL